MKKAVLFRENEGHKIVSAEDVKNGLYSRYEEFVDHKFEEFKVQYVSGAKNNGGPYFRLYYSYEEYKKLFPDRADRYEIVANMRNYRESKWHRQWKENVSDFCITEKYIKNHDTNKWKFADAFYDKTNTCIEFQHSYINWDFEERNEFYSKLSINTIWLYDLPNANVRENEYGYIELLEDNARGFFRISENPNHLKDYKVYIQVKSGMIYRVTELSRQDSHLQKKSTIRYFKPVEVYTEEEFIQAIRSDTFQIHDHCCTAQNQTLDANQPQLLSVLWDKKYKWMIVKDVKNGDIIRINRNGEDEMFRDFSTGKIQYVYEDDKFGYNFSPFKKKKYGLSDYRENQQVWILVNAKCK